MLAGALLGGLPSCQDTWKRQDAGNDRELRSLADPKGEIRVTEFAGIQTQRTPRPTQY